MFSELTQSDHEITESQNRQDWKRPSRSSESNSQYNTTIIIPKPDPQVPHPDVFAILPEMVTPPPPWASYSDA